MIPIETEGLTGFPKHDGETHMDKHPGQKNDLFITKSFPSGTELTTVNVGYK